MKLKRSIFNKIILALCILIVWTVENSNAQSTQSLSIYLEKVIKTIAAKDFKAFDQLTNINKETDWLSDPQYQIPNPSSAVRAAIAKEQQSEIAINQIMKFYFAAHAEKQYSDTFQNKQKENFKFLELSVKNISDKNLEGAILLQEQSTKQKYVAFFSYVFFDSGHYYGYLGTDFVPCSFEKLPNYNQLLEWQEEQKKIKYNIKEESYKFDGDSTMNTVKIIWQGEKISKTTFYNNENEIFTYLISLEKESIKIFNLYKHNFFIKLWQEKDKLYIQKINEDGILSKAIPLQKN